MARRQANLASRIGLHLNSYTIHLIDTSGKTILKDTAYIHATDIDQMTTDTAPLPLPGYPAPIENAKPTSPEIAYPYP
jgi:hypothetical protein